MKDAGTKDIFFEKYFFHSTIVKKEKTDTKMIEDDVCK